LVVADSLADIAVSRGIGESSLPYFQGCKALSQLRQGRLAEAIEWAEKPLNSSHVYARANAYAVLAMAHWQLGHTEQARAMLAQGDSLVPKITFVPNAQNVGGEWLAWLFTRIWLAEATTLIQPVANDANNPNKP